MNTLHELFKQRGELSAKIDKIDAHIKSIKAELSKDITTTQREASTVIFSKTAGVGIVAGRKNSHGERNVSVWNGKKGRTVIERFRGSDVTLRDWFICNVVDL